MEKIWLKSYPAGVPAEVDVAAYSSLKDIIEKSCERYRHLPAFSNMGTTLTYDEIDRLSRSFGAYLQHSAGLKQGDRVAIMMPNLLQYPIVLFGILRAGFVAVNVNPLYTPRELEYQLTDSGAKAIVVLENFAHTLQEVVAKTPIAHVVTSQIGDLFSPVKALITNFVVKYIKGMVPGWSIDSAVELTRILGSTAPDTLTDTKVARDDVAFLQYTGGTTGVPKGAMLTHGNMVANLQQTAAWISTNLKEGAETVVTALPLYHVFSLTANLLTFLKLGGHNVLITNPRDIPAFVKELQRIKFTAITGVNTLFNALLNAPGIRNVDTSTLKLAIGGGMAVQRAVAERW